MAKLIVMCEPRTVLAVLADKSGDHYHGDVIEIVQDDARTDHYYHNNPFLVISVPGSRNDWEYLLDPLLEQSSSAPSSDISVIFRKRHILQIDNLPNREYVQLLATGSASFSVSMLESIVGSRSVA